MRVIVLFGVLVAIFLHVTFASPSEQRSGTGIRDGSTQERAIIVTQSESSYVRWEHQYLHTHFPGLRYVEHATIPDSKDENRGYDLHVIIWRGQKREVWFDISKPFQEFTRKRERKKA